MQNNEEQLHTLLQSIGGIVWEADTDMQRFSFINDQIQPILGFSAEQWKSTPAFWETRIHSDDKKVVSGYRELQGGSTKSRSFEYRLIRADGQIAWIKDTVSVIDKPGQPMLLRGIMLDNSVSERLRTLERLEHDVLRLNSLLTVSVQDVLNSYLEGLEALFPLMLCSFHYIKNRRFTEGISPSLPKAYIDSLSGKEIGKNEGSCGSAAALKRQVIVGDIATDPNWEKYKSIALSHQLRACWSNPVIDADGKVMGTLAIYYREPKLPLPEEMKVMERATALLRIILENRQKTEIISEANMLMRQSQELAQFGNWRWDVQSNVVTWSPVLYFIYGINPKDFVATYEGYQGLLHPEDRRRVSKIIENVLNTREDASFEERIIRPGGEVRYLRSWAKLKSDPQGIPLEMIGACLDITERVSHIETIVERERQLMEISGQNARMIKTLHALEQSHADNTRMLKVVVHDLRSPMGAIKMAASALLHRSDPQDKERHLLQIIQRSADNSLELVNDLLEMQGRPEELKKEPIELDGMLYHCTDLLRHQADAKGQLITLQVVPVIVAASREKLWRVVSNLIANAIKFSPEGMPIHIRLENSTQGVIIAVEDQGIGIPHDMKDKLFDMLTETKRTGTAGEPSFGMGLAISKQIVEAHGGRIWLESKPENGTIFFVELPLQ
ncbi:MAG TPA: PAS domain-containing protein [Mucilaginibacter sp.]|jgi:PAS domain S-box-containing protein